jgi:sugar lactone lactonase YvrE
MDADVLNNNVRLVGDVDTRTLAGTARQDLYAGSTLAGDPAPARWNEPLSLAFDGQGKAFVLDQDNAVIRTFSPAGLPLQDFPGLPLDLSAGQPGIPGDADGPAGTAQLDVPDGITFNPRTQTLFVTDGGQGTGERLRQVHPDGSVDTPAIAPVDGHGFGSLEGLVSDPDGNLYVCDSIRFVIYRMVPTAAGYASQVFAGTLDAPGSTDGPRGDPAAPSGASGTFSVPTAIARLANGNLVVADYGANSIRMVDASGNLTTLAGGMAAGWVDGIGASARFDKPCGVAVDAGDNVYVVEEDNPALRMIAPDGRVSTLMGTPGLQGFDPGLALPGGMEKANRLAFAPDGNRLYITVRDGILLVQLD